MSEIVRQAGQNGYKNVRDLPDHVLETADLHEFLGDYEAPRDKIHRMLSRGLLIQLKRGLFIKSPDMGGRVRPFEIANLLYGPSYGHRPFSELQNPLVTRQTGNSIEGYELNFLTCEGDREKPFNMLKC